MNAILCIARREIQSYLNSPVAYVVLGVFLLFVGYFYFSTLFLIGLASMRNFFSMVPMLLVVFAPALSMRLIAEERKSGTIEPLLILPVKDFEVVLGKFLGGFVIVMIGLLFTIPYALSVAWLVPKGVSFDYGPILGGYLGLAFLSSSFIAFGLLASSLTQNQIVAFVIGFVFCILFFLIDKVAFILPHSLAFIFEFLSVDIHFANIARGVLDSRDLIYYLSLTTITLFLTTQMLRQSRS